MTRPKSTFLGIGIIAFLFACSPTESEGPDIPPGTTIGILEDSFENTDFVVYSNPGIGYMTAFNRNLSGSVMDFELLPESEFPTILLDNEGNKWDIFGQCVDGVRLGEELDPVNSIKGFWFALSAFYREVTLYNEPDKTLTGFTSGDPDWTVDPSDVFFGAPKDGIPSIDQPEFQLVDSEEALEDSNPPLGLDEIVIVFKSSDKFYALPPQILDWHEIVNISAENKVVSYCPLTVTASIWNDDNLSQGSSWGVSGFLFNNNLILYDRDTESYWSQLKQESIHGDRISDEPTVHPYFEMTFETVLKATDEINLLTRNTGFPLNYDSEAYPNYNTNDLINFPLTFQDTRVPIKERVLAIIINGKAKAYRAVDFD